MFGFGKNNKTAADVAKEYSGGYKGFEFIDATDIPDSNSVGLYMRHKKTGLEIFHLINDDDENLFGFAFRTPSDNSTGVAHILEHSVLCGSQKFPLKEPFTNMMNQSVNTFLNAMTYPDKTVYPAASVIKKDYYNLMDVYADAVFFPLLKKEAFMQEAHRLDVNSSDEYEIQGVVYNEMKGCFSSFLDVADNAQSAALYAGTIYDKESGGDPLVIPQLTYEAYKAFYEKYYRSDNCILFLYGNISTKEQIDFLQKILLDRLENKFPLVPKHDKYPYVSPLITAMEHKNCLPPLKDGVHMAKVPHVKETAPASGSSGCTVVANFLCGETANVTDTIECMFLCEVLMGHEASPLRKALFESQLGDDTVRSYCDTSRKQFSVALGLQGVVAHNEKKVYDLIYTTLQKCVDNGINKNEIAAALMTFEISVRAIYRYSGPHSIDLLETVLKAWNYGAHPASHLLLSKNIKILKEKLAADPHFTEKLINKYFLLNQNRVHVIVKPSKSYTTNRKKIESTIIQKLSRSTDLQMVKAELEILHEYQSHYEDESETSCLGSLEIKDLTKRYEPIKTDLSTCEGVLVAKNVEDTNGLAYTEVWYPCDTLSPEDYLYLNLFGYAAMSTGGSNFTWEGMSQEIAVNTGGINTLFGFHQTAPGENSAKLAQSLAHYNFLNRDWFVLSLRGLGDDFDRSLAVFAKALKGYNFADKKRLATIVKQCQNNIKLNLISQPSALTRLRADLSYHSDIVKDTILGATQIFAIDKIVAENIDNLSSHLTAMKATIHSGGSFVKILCDKENDAKVTASVQQFIKDVGLTPLKQKPKFDEETFRKQALLPNQKSLSQSEVFVTPSSVGYGGFVIDGAVRGTKEFAASLVLGHYLSGTILWEKLRTMGGAYGASASSLEFNSKFFMSTFRDPTPFSSLNVLKNCISEVAKSPIDNNTLKQMIIGTYSDEIQPLCATDKSSLATRRLLRAESDADLKSQIENILKVTSKDITDLCAKLISNLSTQKQIVVTAEAKDIGAVVVKLPTE